jgi:uncharacterized lipoprotein YbaY
MASLTACDSPKKPLPERVSEEEKITIVGRLTYPGPISLPGKGKIEIHLRDSRRGSDVYPQALGYTSTKNLRMPLRFTIEIPKDMVNPRYSYAVYAHIADGSGKRMFATGRNSVALDGRQTIDLGSLNLVKTN